MNVLAVDTSNEQGSVALAREGNLLELVVLPPGWRSTTLHSEIERLLQRHGLATGDIQGYGVTTGPGSFTGVRVGLTAVKGLAEVHAKPIVAVSTLEMLAVAAMKAWDSQSATSPLRSGACQLPKPTVLVTILDARRGQIFGGVYRKNGDLLEALIGECVCSLPAFLERLNRLCEEANRGQGIGNLEPTASLERMLGTGNSDVAAGLKASERIAILQDLAFCSTDLAPLIPEIERAGWGGALRLQVSPWLAGPLALFATEKLRKGLGVSAAAADANYVRPSDAELFWKE